MVTMKYYDIEELDYLDDNKNLDILKTSWGFEKESPLQVLGEVTFAETSSGNYIYKLINVRNYLNNNFLEYPINELIPRQLISNRGIFIPSSFNKKIKKYILENNKLLIVCNLELSHKSERQKQENPLLLNVIKDTIEVFHNVEEHFITFNDNKIQLKDSILNYLKFKYEEEINLIIKNLEESNKQKFNILKSKNEYLEAEISIIKKKIEKEDIKYEQKKQENQEKIDLIDEKLVNAENEIELKIQKLNIKIKAKEKTLEKLDENKKLIIREIEEKNREKQSLLNFIEELKIEIEKIEETMAKKLEKFRGFIKDKAEQLLKLEFIDEEEYNDLLMIKKDDSNINEKTISFKDDLSSDYQKAISHIHSYLFKQDIIYPRYILEDFMALIQTNDLIVLAGESGSGKTNLVKSFAKAIGGKSFIIPVKPNWTSAEDLLGYYNPLEKKYLTTPFLDALLEAKNNPDTPYFICLDEMNLARVEYYFADFLSLLEERDTLPEVQLYSEDESGHVLSELKNVLDLINSTKEKYQKSNLTDFMSILRDEEVNSELKRVFGFSDKDSLIKYHTELRKMIGGLLNTPSSIKFPKNVRIIGAINIDETTHYLSPKILDRAHIMKFDSPLLYDWAKISDEIYESDKGDYLLNFQIKELGVRKVYPSFNRDEEFCKLLTIFTKKYFTPLGIEVGLRTIRQGLNYQQLFIDQGSDQKTILNNFIIHKILPKMTFDGSKKVVYQNEEKEKIKLLSDFMNDLKNYIDHDTIEYESNNSILELEHIIKNANTNNGIVNYWT